MALIRYSLAGAQPRDAIVLNLAELGEQAEAITRRAREQAERTIAEAQAERRRLIDTATAEGFAAGKEAGLRQGIEEGRAQGAAEARAAQAETLSALQASWSAALDKFEAQRDDMLSHARADVLALALAIARRVTRRAVEADESAAPALAQAALELVLRPTRLVLRVHPTDVDSVRAEASALASRLAGARHAEIMPDDSLSRGSVIVESDKGRIDASIETQLERIAEALLPGGPRRVWDQQPPPPPPPAEESTT